MHSGSLGWQVKSKVWLHSLSQFPQTPPPFPMSLQILQRALHPATPTPCFCLCLCGCSIYPSSLSPESPSSEKPSLIPLASPCLIPLFAYLLSRQDCNLLGEETDVSQSLLQLYGPAQGLTQAQEAADSVVRAQILELHCLGSNIGFPINLLLCSWI